MRTAAEIQADRDFLRSELDVITDGAVNEDETRRLFDEDEQERWDAGLAALAVLDAEDQERSQIAALADVQSDPAHDRLAPAPERRQGEQAGRERSASHDQLNAYERSLTGNPTHVRAARDEAFRMLDAQIGDGSGRVRADEMLRGVRTSDGGKGAGADYVAQHFLVYGNDAYREAFGAYVAAAPGGFAPTLDGDSARALQTADRFRAMNVGTGTAGGLQVPTHINPTIRLMDQSAQDGVSGIANHQTLTGGANVFNTVSSAGVAVEYPGEATEVADGAPTIVDVSIPTHKGDVFIPVSIEYDQDVGMAGQIQRLLDDAMTRNAAVVFTTGTGSGQPTSIDTALDAVTTSEVDTDTTLLVVAQDIRDLKFLELPAGFRGSATWLMNDAINSHIQGFADAANGASLFTVDLSDGYVQRLVGSPVQSASAMPADATPAIGASVAIIGDFSNYYIIHKLDSTLEFIQNLLGANQRPTGERGWVTWFRHGGGLGSTETGTDGPANAFRLLQGSA